MTQKTIFLVDASSFVFRAYYAMPELTNSTGHPTFATYGVINMLKNLQNNYVMDYLACIFDTVGENFRQRIYPEYKANRSKTPANLLQQLDDIYALVMAMGIKVIMRSGVEADDIIGSIAVKYAKDHKVIIVTGDKDFTQLIDENNQITLLNTMNNTVTDHSAVYVKYAVYPNQMIDYLSLVGDAVDNIPGISKCGPKTAAKWLQKYGSIDNILLHQHDIDGQIGDNLRSQASWLKVAQKLVTIDTTIDLANLIPNGLNELIPNNPDEQVLYAHYERLGFKRWINTELITNHGYDVVTGPVTSIALTQQHIDFMLQHGDNVLTLLLIWGSGYIFYTAKLANLPVYLLIKFGDSMYVVDINADMDLARAVVNLPHKKITGDYKALLTYFSSIENVVGDLVVAHYLYNPGSNASLLSICNNYITPVEVTTSTTVDLFTDIIFDKHIFLILNNLSSLERYLTTQLSQKQLDLYKNTELPLVNIIRNIERSGITLDVSRMKEISLIVNKRIYELQEEIYQKVGCVFNINSSQQLQNVLFEVLGLSTAKIKKNKTGYSTDEDSLHTLHASGVAIAATLLEYRNLTKLQNTYLSKLPEHVDEQNKLHTTLEQTVVLTGRLSSRDPNLQNIPIKTSYGAEVRKCFIASAECQLVAADYSQIELRILAHLSQDQALLTAFANNADIHAITASELFNKPLHELTTQERRYGKTINFSIIYGKTAFGLAKELNITNSVAQTYIDKYFAKYSSVKNYLAQNLQHARAHGFVESVFGRKINLPNITSHNKHIREAEERVANNAPMQATAADIIKFAMIDIDHYLKQHNLHSKMVLQIHDELLLDVPNNELDIIKTALVNLMTRASLTVPLKVDINSAANWFAAH